MRSRPRQLAGAAVPSKLTALLWRLRPRSRVGSVRLGPSTSTSMVRPTKRWARSRARRWTTLDEPLHALDLDRLRDLLVHLGGLGAPARREDEGEGAVVADLLGHLERLAKSALGLAREADFAETLEVVDAVPTTAPSRSSSRRGAGRGREMDDQVPQAVKKEASSASSTSSRSMPESAGRFVGRTMEVLVEGPSRTTRPACAGAPATTRP